MYLNVSFYVRMGNWNDGFVQLSLQGSFVSASASASSLPNVVSPVGSYDKGGLWSGMMGTGTGTGGGSGPGAPTPGAINGGVNGGVGRGVGQNKFDPLDRAETPGISAEDAAHLLDSLEDGLDDEDEAAAFVPFGGASNGHAHRVGTYGPSKLVVKGLPEGADELWIYKKFARHGALLDVVVEEGEATVEFAKGAEAVAAMKSMDGRDALSVIAAEGGSPSSAN